MSRLLTGTVLIAAGVLKLVLPPWGFDIAYKRDAYTHVAINIRDIVAWGSFCVGTLLLSLALVERLRRS